MGNQNNKCQIVNVHSIELLKKLCEAKCLGLLMNINHTDFEYPYFNFAGKPDVLKVIGEFKNEHIDDRSIDDPACWKLYEKPYQGEKLIYTRNYSVVTDVIEKGFGAMLRSVDIQENRKVFAFVYTREIRNIKLKWDAISKANWLEKQKAQADNSL